MSLSPVAQFLLFLLGVATVQNLVLSAGFGSSVLLRVVRRPRELLLFGGLLTGFSVLTVLAAYPLDSLMLRHYTTANLLRPVVMIAITALLYIATGLILRHWFAAAYQRVSRLLPLAAFNNLVIGTALIANRQIALSLFGVIGLSVGACLGFLLLSLLTAEAIERADNPAMPQAFRGLPATLLYLGILALALLGFSNVAILG